ncbi:MAG: hypothetical protein GEU96_09495 [Propionibacteriales bacterium]|nr:hypothetical protein [Propionibacteriales bacterium]
MQPGARAPAPAALLPAQDLVNTLDLEAERDLLGSPADLRRWAKEHAVSGHSFGADDLADTIEFREALRDVCLSHTGVEIPAASSAALDRLLRRAPLLLSVDTAGASVRPADGLGGAEAVVAMVAAGIAQATADGSWPRLKACASDRCRWVYYDRSPSGRSRWCTMAICGSRAKMRAYRERSKA